MKTENLYRIDEMSRDARTYIALGIEWVRYHTEKMDKKNESKKEKIKEDMKEYILKAWDKIDFFEKTAGADILIAIAELTENEKGFVTLAKNVREEFISQELDLTKKDASNIEYMRKLVEKTRKAQDRLYKAELKDEIADADKELENCYKRLGDMFILYRLERYIDSFTIEEQEYIFSGRTAILASRYVKEAEKARRFLARCEKMHQAADSAINAGMEFVKMENSNDTEGENTANVR